VLIFTFTSSVLILLLFLQAIKSHGSLLFNLVFGEKGSIRLRIHCETNMRCGSQRFCILHQSPSSVLLLMLELELGI